MTRNTIAALRRSIANDNGAASSPPGGPRFGFRFRFAWHDHADVLALLAMTAAVTAMVLARIAAVGPY